MEPARGTDKVSVTHNNSLRSTLCSSLDNARRGITRGHLSAAASTLKCLQETIMESV